MLKKFLALLLVAGVAGSAFAAENDEPSGRGRRGRGERGMMMRRGGMPGFGRGASMLQRFKAENDLSKKYPEEYAKIEKQLFEAEEAMRALAKKAKVELPDSIESKIRTLKQKQPQGFAELLEEENPRAAAAKLMNLAKENGVELFPAGMMNRRRPGMDKEAPAQKEQSMRRSGRVNMAKLRKLYPEEMQKLEELRTSDPAAYKAGLLELSKKMKKDAKKAASEK